MKQKALIGIDPDCDKSGYALCVNGKLINLECYDLFDMMIVLSDVNERYDLTVHLEAGWKISKSNFSDRNVFGSRNANEKIAAKVGANHEIGRQLEKYLMRLGIKYQLRQPAGYSAYSHEYFCAITQWPALPRTNSEKRVAGMLVYGIKC